MQGRWTWKAEKTGDSASTRGPAILHLLPHQLSRTIASTHKVVGDGEGHSAELIMKNEVVRQVRILVPPLLDFVQMT